MHKRTFLRLIITIGLVAMSMVTDASAQGRAMERAVRVQEKFTDGLMTRHGVVGTAVGQDRAGAPAVTVLVETRADAAGLPANLDGIPVKVLVTGKILALKRPSNGREAVDHTARFKRPVPIGVSTGHPDITAGTIGARVKDGNGNVYALSNNHVYADENLAVRDSDPVLQPGPYDGGGPGDEIGKLFDFKPIDFSASAQNEIDAALALSSAGQLSNQTPQDGYGIPKSSIVSPAIGMNVMKCGRTTGETSGQIAAINATVDVAYTSGTARFVNQIIITPGTFSGGGDSGSLIVVYDMVTSGRGKNKVTEEGADHRKPVGLLFAGSATVTVANPIDAVLDAFGVTIDGE